MQTTLANRLSMYKSDGRLKLVILITWPKKYKEPMISETYICTLYSKYIKLCTDYHSTLKLYKTYACTYRLVYNITPDCSKLLTIHVFSPTILSSAQAAQDF